MSITPGTFEVVDWRGTRVEPGQTVIYATSGAPAEGRVERLTATGRVTVRPLRRADNVTSTRAVSLKSTSLTVATLGEFSPFYTLPEDEEGEE